MKAYELTGTEATRISYLAPRKAKLADKAALVLSLAFVAFVFYEAARVIFR